MQRFLPSTAVWGVLAAALAGGCSSAPAPAPEQVRITLYRDFPDGKPLLVEKVVVVADPQEAERLASFFPGMGRGRSSRHAGTSALGARIEFVFDDGHRAGVTVDSDLACWSEGSGDFEVVEGFRPYLLELLKRQAAPPQEHAGGGEPQR